MTAAIDFTKDTAVYLYWPSNRPPAELPDKLRRRVLRSNTLGFTLEGMTVRKVMNRLNAIYKKHGYRIRYLQMGSHFVTGNRWRRRMRPGDRLIVHRFYPLVEPEPVAQGTVVHGNPKRRARLRTVTEEHRRRLKPCY